MHTHAVKVSFLLISFLLSHSAYSFTVILKSGKRMEGARIGEDQSAIQIKGEDGVVYSFRKAILDLQQMDDTNNSTPPVAAPRRNGETPELAAEPDLVELAATIKKNRTGKARVYDASDISRAPEISIFGTDLVPSSSPKSDSASTNKQEHSWRKEALALRKDVARLREKKLQLQAVCGRAKEEAAGRLASPHKKVIDITALYAKPVECERRDEIGNQLQAAQQRLDDFLERGRRSEIPSQWLE